MKWVWTRKLMDDGRCGRGSAQWSGKLYMWWCVILKGMDIDSVL